MAGAGQYCRSNGDCNQGESLCCQSFILSPALGDINFVCLPHLGGLTSVGRCLANGTNYIDVCNSQAKVCQKTNSKFAACGSVFAMKSVDYLPDMVCWTNGSLHHLTLSALVLLLGVTSAFIA